VNCALNALEKSDFSNYKLNRKTLMENFDIDLPISASLVEEYLPQIKEHLGEDKQLNIDV